MLATIALSTQFKFRIIETRVLTDDPLFESLLDKLSISFEKIGTNKIIIIDYEYESLLIQNVAKTLE